MRREKSLSALSFGMSGRLLLLEVEWSEMKDSRLQEQYVLSPRKRGEQRRKEWRDCCWNDWTAGVKSKMKRQTFRLRFGIITSHN
jgi:hypothetical protein